MKRGSFRTKCRWSLFVKSILFGLALAAGAVVAQDMPPPPQPPETNAPAQQTAPQQPQSAPAQQQTAPPPQQMPPPEQTTPPPEVPPPPATTPAQAKPLDAKARAKAVRDYAKGGSATVEKLAEYLNDPDIDVRIEAVKGIDEIGGPGSVAPLLHALSDPDPEVQIRATDGLVNFYAPGYLQRGNLLHRAGTAIKSHFTDTNDQVIDPWVEVRPDVIIALGKVVRGGASTHARANAARAIGVLRGRAAIPDLLQAMRAKEDEVLYESLNALEKIHDPTVAPQILWLLRDPNEKVQIAALETTGLLQNRSALPDVRDALDRARNEKVRRAALEAIALMPDESVHGVLTSYLTNKDDALRGSAAEGLARLKNPADKPALQRMFNEDKKTAPRLGAAFGLVALGDTSSAELGPLRYLVSTLNSVGYRDVARPYLVELARDPNVRQALYPMLQGATREEKTGLADVFARSGGKDSLPYLETLSRDPDTTVAQEGLRALRTLQARTSAS